MERIRFLNTYVDNVTMCEAVSRIDQLINCGGYHYVVTPNIDHIVRLEQDDEFKMAYKSADLIYTDGMPLVWISRLFGHPIKEKISGSDLFPKICELAAMKQYKIFLLGAAEGVAAKASINLRKKYDGLNIVGVYSPEFGFEKSEGSINKIIEAVRKSKPHILIVGLGAPKQEKFIFKYKDKLAVPITLAVGASIDFEAGEKKRAPKWMQNHGLEWFYRFLKEPRRLFKRYFISSLNIVYIFFKGLVSYLQGEYK
ncbi:MAG: WecB/TagA/CpsF family glycosyltransferase [Clostridiaceae bacterium]